MSGHYYSSINLQLEKMMEETKITTKIYVPMLESFNKQINRLHIKRDSYLNAMIKSELPYLEKEMRGKVLSSKAKKYIAGSLKRMGTHNVNIVVEKETAERLNKIVSEYNLVRYAFINRLIVFLRSSESFLENIGLPLRIDTNAYKNMVWDLPTSPLRAIEEVMTDPLFYLRTASEEMDGIGLYERVLPHNMVGFCCYIEDVYVPDTIDYKEFHAELALKLDMFESK